MRPCMLNSAERVKLTIELLPFWDSNISSSLMKISGIGYGSKAWTVSVCLSGIKVSKALSSEEYLKLFELFISWLGTTTLLVCLYFLAFFSLSFGLEPLSMFATWPLIISSWVSVTRPSFDSLFKSVVVVRLRVELKFRNPKRSLLTVLEKSLFGKVGI